MPKVTREDFHRAANIVGSAELDEETFLNEDEMRSLLKQETTWRADYVYAVAVALAAATGEGAFAMAAERSFVFKALRLCEDPECAETEEADDAMVRYRTRGD